MQQTAIVATSFIFHDRFERLLQNCCLCLKMRWTFSFHLYFPVDSVFCFALYLSNSRIPFDLACVYHSIHSIVGHVIFVLNDFFGSLMLNNRRSNFKTLYTLMPFFNSYRSVRIHDLVFSLYSILIYLHHLPILNTHISLYTICKMWSRRNELTNFWFLFCFSFYLSLSIHLCSITAQVLMTQSKPMDIARWPMIGITMKMV